jgi:hypothetical protein
MRLKNVSTRWLKKQCACPNQVTLFKATFGKSCRITPETIRRAAEIGLRLNWFAWHAFNLPQRVIYNRAVDSAVIVFDKAMCDACSAYKETADEAIFKQVRTDALAAYHQTLATAIIAILFPGKASS